MGKRISLILVILWMILIFILSNMPGELSNRASKKIVYEICTKVNLCNKDMTIFKYEEINDNFFNKLHYYFRKSMHFNEYLVLALLILNYLKYYNKSYTFKILISITICFVYSLTDEIHQIFTPNRTPLFKDCLIDTSGAITGCLIFLIFIYFKKKLSLSKNNDKIL